MKLNSEDCRPGIYCIQNIVNNKVYIGKSKNIYERVYNHRRLLRLNNYKYENEYLIKSWIKYGEENFKYFVLEYLPLDENLAAERELYWMDYYESYNPLKGYNLRRDSDSKMIVHNKTKNKMSLIMEEQWRVSKIRKDHGEKMKQNWAKTPERKKLQATIMTKRLTKYYYNVQANNGEILFKEVAFNKLRELDLQGVLAKYAYYKTNIVKYKGFTIERLLIDDIVRHS